MSTALSLIPKQNVVNNRSIAANVFSFGKTGFCRILSKYMAILSNCPIFEDCFTMDVVGYVRVDVTLLDHYSGFTVLDIFWSICCIPSASSRRNRVKYTIASVLGIKIKKNNFEGNCR